ncbi:RdgB/HAM1 family non-canonical purine NTP pyrophosphatase [Pseudooceanicola sp. CBS1P-1]|uniref:dITP/XTP pyrophosphatase n=1 Tax=Pseudooceanicola albus TaxID=2692189 RepID=A0A6L7G044_9RHOB|nr:MULTISPECIES: RdgB/HAM1 family non-canonical purine NTP pyrophosphatase [Pseudooceanicola]MBT9385703.1 RdgB/HAM1 family non-canonical purine NTP pyrophosphatase [Pseudooceanicola endophyticus]MXN16737.1 RdgB/HAM1 family non-canonical purine NTP pyrophosphatase [Pseudooceanicola albus]
MRKFDGKELVLATHNKGKLEEISALLAPFGITVTSAADHGLEEPVEDQDNFIGNARIKAHYAAKATGLPALSDDSGISVDGLDGAPGVYTADWAETDHGRDFPMAMAKVWDELEARNAPYPRTAAFNCTLCLAWPDGQDEIFVGRMPGQCVWPMRGDNGHGYDPMFQPEGFDVTFAEMTSEQKNAISHRSQAFEKLVQGCFA